jgi:hypothetical protein
VDVQGLAWHTEAVEVDGPGDYERDRPTEEDGEADLVLARERPPAKHYPRQERDDRGYALKFINHVVRCDAAKGSCQNLLTGEYAKRSDALRERVVDDLVDPDTHCSHEPVDAELEACQDNHGVLHARSDPV